MKRAEQLQPGDTAIDGNGQTVTVRRVRVYRYTVVVWWRERKTPTTYTVGQQAREGA